MSALPNNAGLQSRHIPYGCIGLFYQPVIAVKYRKPKNGNRNCFEEFCETLRTKKYGSSLAYEQIGPLSCVLILTA
ncbi:MAG TPA: hypothetical protein DEH15_09400 [Marinilabiliales bacterium]|nr:hypothetical protein [Marinilabiliales bacterium]HBY52645.1 hypothetical protein [Marinilabiliales bacterium]